MNNNVTIIAEAGVNHNGDIDLAKKMIDQAYESGADYVKFQAFTADRLVSREAKKADYQVRNLKDEEEEQYGMLKKLEMDKQVHETLMDYARAKGIGFLSSPFDEQGIIMLHDLGMEIFKVPSGEITNYPYLQRLGALDPLEIILSTGMCTLGEIEQALSILIQEGVSAQQITILQCNTNYPTDYRDVNLKAMQTIGCAFGTAIGYSDHTLGIEVPIAAVALGATVIEKHFTLDRSMEGPDHKASLELDELKRMVQSIRNIETALGNGIKKPSDSERKNRAIVRKSIHLNCNVKPNMPLNKEHLIMLRPGDGLSPMQLPEVLGKQTCKALPKGHKLMFSDLKL